MKIYYSRKFARKYRKLSKAVKKLAEEKELFFRQNPFDPRLKTHRLTGGLEGFWSFSVDYKYRIIFEFRDEETVWFYAVGTHDIYPTPRRPRVYPWMNWSSGAGCSPQRALSWYHGFSRGAP